jgi:Chalcone isomerase-like
MNIVSHRFEAPLAPKLFAVACLSVAFFVLSGISTVPQALAQNKSIAASSVPNSRLLGSGTLRWLAFKVYDARLYGPIELASAKNWQQVPLALQLTYARSIKGEQIAQTSADEISRLGTGDSAKIAAWSTAMKQLFPDVKEGDQIVGVYKPNQSVAFFLNGKPLTISSGTGTSSLGALSDPNFGKAFFAIWLDTKTRDQGLRKALLGQLADESTSGGSSNTGNLNSPASTN